MNTNKFICCFIMATAMADDVAMAAPCKYENTPLIGDIRIITQKNGKTLGYSERSGIQILEVDGFAFKDLNRNGVLDKYEDWRLPYEERARDLASKLSIEEIAGLMLYSSHQSVPAPATGMGSGTYNGESIDKGVAQPSDITDQQKRFLLEDHLRHILVTKVASPEVAATWSNNVQTFVEGIGHGVPVNNSSDPRHGTNANTEFNYGAGGQISLWPGQLGLAATFNPAIVRRFGEIASHEYRALGITTALSPQIDLGTEPRWSRINGTFGEDPDLVVDMARAYCDGFQSSEDAQGGWGKYSVNAMVKHWPGGGPEEGGRDGHFGYGKYAVYPGDNFSMHLRPFTEGAFQLQGGTQKASAVMPYYTISYGQNGGSGSNRGNGYNRYLITDLLRDTYHYDGVVCSDWGITQDCNSVSKFEGKCWGTERLTVSQRHYELIKAGIDQFGGNNDKKPVLEAYYMGVDEFGKKTMRHRFEQSATRLLLNMFRTGLFENPYIDPRESSKIVGCSEYMEAGYQAQLQSIVMLKNKRHVLPIQEKAKVYVPKRFHKATPDWWGNIGEDYWKEPVSESIVNQYYTLVENPEDADFAIVFIQSPDGGTGYSEEDRQKGGNGYVPINLQYSDYKATEAREYSIAGGAPDEDFVNRSYKNKQISTINKTDAELVQQTRKLMGEKPVIVSIETVKPFVIADIEKDADAILLNFEIQAQAVLDVVKGKYEPTGLLPIQLPANMKEVECQSEDVPRDMAPYVDSEKNSYDFAFGMNWKGTIKDCRVEKYK